MRTIRFLLRLPGFLVHYAWLVLTANVQVIRDVLTTTDYARPAVIKVRLHVTRPSEIFLLTNLLTMTPGTLSLDLDPDGKHLYVHVMFYDGDGVRHEIRDLERRVGGLFT